MLGSLIVYKYSVKIKFFQWKEVLRNKKQREILKEVIYCIYGVIEQAFASAAS